MHTHLAKLLGRQCCNLIPSFRETVYLLQSQLFLPFNRLYSVLKPTSPEEIISLGESSSLTAEYSRKSLSVGSMSSFAAALGEKAIAFDFAPPTAAPVPRARLNSSVAETDVTHPIFILRENGDIYYLVHRISQSR